jgi:hypothetical protein
LAVGSVCTRTAGKNDDNAVAESKELSATAFLVD